MASQPPPSTAAFSHDGRHSTTFSTVNRPIPSTALLIEYYENVANKGNMPSVRVRVNPVMAEHQQDDRTSYVSPLPTRANTVMEQREAEHEEETGFEQQEQDSTPAAPDPTRGRQRTRVVSGQTSVPVEEDEEEEEPLPQIFPPSDRRIISDPLSLPALSSITSNDVVSSRQFQAIIASAIQELILPEIQAVRNELTAQAQLFHHQPGLNQASNQATFGTSTSGRKRSRSLTALDAPLHRRNSLSIGTMEGYQGEVVPLPPRPTSPNVPAAMEAESLLRADLRSELKITPPGTPNRALGTASHRLSGLTDAPHHVQDPSSHTVFNLAEGAYRKRESHEERMAQAKARRAAEKRLRGEPTEDDIPEDSGDVTAPVNERTRFSMMTGDRGESIHDFIEDEGSHIAAYRDGEIAELKSQLDNILEYLKSSAADRSDRETDILAQISVLAENTQRSLQNLKDTVLEETNVTVGALSYNIERYVGRVVQGPRPLPEKSSKALGKSASYPQDNRTSEHVGPMKRTTTFFQGIGQALTPAQGRASREKREGMERLEAMMQRVLEEVEMLKRMKQGARRKTNGEMFKGDARSRLNPPEDAVTYIDEVRGDTANRERGESEEERMARIERSAQDYEEERSKRSMMQTAVATETDIFRQTSKDARAAQKPLEGGVQVYPFPVDHEGGQDEAISGRRLTPLRIEPSTTHQFTPTGPAIIPHRPIPILPTLDDDVNTPSAESFARGDDRMFNAGRPRLTGQDESSPSDTAENERMAARLSQVHDETRKISIKDPIGLPSTDDALPSGSARESGVLGDHHLDSESGRAPPEPWIDRTDRSTEPPTPIAKDEHHKRRLLNAESPLPPIIQDFEQPGPSVPLQTVVGRQRSQYFFKDEHGRLQFFMAPSQESVDKITDGHEWGHGALQHIKHAITPRKAKDKGKGKEVVHNVDEEPISVVHPRSTPEQPLPSLFAVTEPLESSPSKRLRKKGFRKPITTPFELKYTPPVTAQQQPVFNQPIDLEGDDSKFNSPEKKARRSWRDFLGHRSQAPQEPATLTRPPLPKPITMTYAGPGQEVHGRNGFSYFHGPTETEHVDILYNDSSHPQPPAVMYRDSMSESVREVALYNMQLSEQLALGRLPAGTEIATDVQWMSHQRQAQQLPNPKAPEPQIDEEVLAPAGVIPGPFAHVQGDQKFIPTPAMREPMIVAPVVPEKPHHPEIRGDQKSIPTPAMREPMVVAPVAPVVPDKLHPEVRGDQKFIPTPAMREPMVVAHVVPERLLPEITYAPTEPLTPQKHQTIPVADQSPQSEDENSLYDSAAIRHAFNNTLQRRPTPPNPVVPVARAPRGQSNLAEQRRLKRPITLKAVADAEKAAAAAVVVNGSTSPSKTESSYRTANEATGEQERANDGVRPPSVYSHDSIGGERFSRQRGRSPPDTFSLSSADDFSSSTRPLDPAAPARYTYNSPGASPRNSHLNKPTRVPSGPRVQPPNFSQTKTMHREDRYSRPSFAASDYTRRTSEDTTELAVMGTAVKTDLRKGNGPVTANWVRKRPVEELRA